MTSKEQLMDELDHYSKEEIIEAIADTDSILAQRITSKLNQNSERAIAAATDAYENATANFESYRKQTKETYGTLISRELPAAVRRHLLNLKFEVDITSDRLEFLKARQRIRENEQQKNG